MRSGDWGNLFILANSGLFLASVILQNAGVVGRPTVDGGRAGGILSIPAQEVSLGSPRVGTRHVHAPTPHTPPLQAFLVDFSQQAAEE